MQPSYLPPPTRPIPLKAVSGTINFPRARRIALAFALVLTTGLVLQALGMPPRMFAIGGPLGVVTALFSRNPNSPGFMQQVSIGHVDGRIRLTWKSTPQYPGRFETFDRSQVRKRGGVVYEHWAIGPYDVTTALVNGRAIRRILAAGKPDGSGSA